MNRVVLLFLLIAGVLALINLSKINTSLPAPLVPEDPPFRTYTAPIIPNKPAYIIFLLGDSMTHALGPHGGTFNEFINDLYRKHGKGVLVDNYAVGGTNILTIQEAMNKETTYWDSTFGPLLSRDFDLILIESFGYNPLSESGTEEGLKKQTEALDGVMKTLIKTHPNSAIVFVATIAPNKANYALTVNRNIAPAERAAQAEERIAYIKNHIAYANAHNIPVINIFEKSLNAQGDGNLQYINKDDYIHPSAAGVDFIGHELANFIYDNHILPH